jgi:predicted ATP-grasp superfamily ATP-dependent carboligase
MSKPGVIVIGGHVQGLGITRIYGKNGIPVILLDDNKPNLTKHSKYCKRFIHYNKGELHKKLIQLGITGEYADWMLVPTNDGVVELLSKNKTELSTYFKVSTDTFDVLEHFFNKRLSYKLAPSLGIPIPKTWMGDSWEEISKMDLVYPCIIKPAVMHTFYSQFKTKVFVCNNLEEVKENYQKALTIIPFDEIIIQDIIPGNSSHQYSACFMFDGKKPLVTLTARRARQHPPDFGNATTYAETVDLPELVEYAKKLLSSINFKGVCEVEFKFDERDGQYKFLEVNPRSWKWHSIAEKSGSPVLMSLYNYIYGKEPIIKNEQSSATFRHLMTDIPTIINMKMKGIDVPKTKKNTKYAVWDTNDLSPAFWEILYVPYFILKR